MSGKCFINLTKSFPTYLRLMIRGSVKYKGLSKLFLQLQWIPHLTFKRRVGCIYLVFSCVFSLLLRSHYLFSLCLSLLWLFSRRPNSEDCISSVPLSSIFWLKLIKRELSPREWRKREERGHVIYSSTLPIPEYPFSGIFGLSHIWSHVLSYPVQRHRYP